MPPKRRRRPYGRRSNDVTRIPPPAHQDVANDGPVGISWFARRGKILVRSHRETPLFMAGQSKSNESEVQRNYEAFRQKLPELLQVHRGKFALMHHRDIVDFFDTAGDAYKFGVKQYG